MDDFFVYGDTFNEAMENLEKVLIKSQETDLDLSHESALCCLKKEWSLATSFHKPKLR